MRTSELKATRRGRASRVASRTSAVVEVDPCPPGQHGGPVPAHSAITIWAKSLTPRFRILEDIGMSEVPPVLMQQALDKGASVNALGRLSFSRAFVEDVIDTAPKKIVLHGRDPKHDL